MKHKLIVLSLAICMNIAAFANNITVTNIVVNQSTQNVTFTVSWDNSWYITSAPANWDAAWILVKWRLCGDGDGISYTQGVLSATTANHTYTNLTAMTTVNGTITQSAAQGVTLDYTDGIMLRPAAVASGTITSNVSLRVTNLPAAGTDITVSVFGLEMVYVPQGNFSIGDGNGGTGRAAYTFTNSTSGSVYSPLTINSGYETGLSTIYVDAPSGTPTAIGSIPLAFPKGQYGFYIMKNEISEGAYAEFLNSIGFNSAAAAARYPGNFTTNRNRLDNTVLPYNTTRQDRAQNWLSWADVSAFLDWACLRPMTELEYEKASRGLNGAVTSEYAWGTTSITNATTFAGAGLENGAETFTAGNTLYNGIGFVNGDGGAGPARVGIFATASSSRTSAGASYYGVMEMSGNVREVVVALHGTGGSNTYTRTWGNGTITAAGIHDMANWPASATTVTANSLFNLVGHRGGSWTDVFGRLQVSDRDPVYTAPNIGRLSYTGGRGLR